MEAHINTQNVLTCRDRVVCTRYDRCYKVSLPRVHSIIAITVPTKRALKRSVYQVFPFLVLGVSTYAQSCTGTNLLALGFPAHVSNQFVIHHPGANIRPRYVVSLSPVDDRWLSFFFVHFTETETHKREKQRRHTNTIFSTFISLRKQSTRNHATLRSHRTAGKQHGVSASGFPR